MQDASPSAPPPETPAPEPLAAPAAAPPPAAETSSASPQAEASPLGSGAPPAPEMPAAPSPIAPGVPRLGTPSGATRRARSPEGNHPSYLFLAVVALLTLAADVSTKLWAEQRLERYPPFVTVWEDHLAFVLARNRGGAWGLLQGTNENVRRPFFLLVSAAAIAFIVTLYRRLQPRQVALRWGLPLVLGGALGNVFDRIRYGHVIDFIDYRAAWVHAMNEIVARVFAGGRGSPTDHWPTFNVADVAICVGVGLMAVDMLTAKRAPEPPHAPAPPLAPKVPATTDE